MEVFKKQVKISILALVLIVIIIGTLKVFPQFLYKNSIQVENYTIYSNDFIDSSIIQIIDTVNILVKNDMVNISNQSFDVYLTNSYFLFWLHTFLNRKPTGASNFITDDIFIANANLEKNYVYNFTKAKKIKSRSIHSVIAHESTHIILRREFGFWKYRSLLKHCNWKVEGFCEWIAFNGIEIDNEKIQKIIKSKSYINNPYDRYMVYRAAVDYLIVNNGYNVQDLMTSSDNFEDIINKYATQQPI